MNTALVTLADLENSLQEDSPSEEMARQLVHTAKWYLEHAETLEAARNIHDALVRLQIQFEQHRATLYATNMLTAGRIRTEWHIGKTLKELPRDNGGRPSQTENVSNGGNSFLVAIEKAGIEKSSAYRWQKLAEVDPQDLELYFEELQQKGEEISTNSVLNYFTSHVTLDADAPDVDETPEPPEMNDDLPQVRVVTIVCRHCGAKDAYEVG